MIEISVLLVQMLNGFLLQPNTLTGKNEKENSPDGGLMKCLATCREVTAPRRAGAIGNRCQVSGTVAKHFMTHPHC